MQAKDLALALSIITKAYPEAAVIPQETEPKKTSMFIVVAIPGFKAMKMHEHLESILIHLGFKYSDCHGACWYATL